jgi:molybdenum cofactor cytidylyltransferase
MPSPRHDAISGVVLAAGASTRMGRPKQLLPLDGRPLLQHVLDAAAGSQLGEIILVLGAHASEVRGAIALPAGGRVRVIVNEQYERGQSESLRCALAAADPDAAAAAILLGDQPGVTSARIDEVLAGFRAGTAPIARPVYGGGTPGHPVVIARHLWPEVERVRGDEGMRSLLAAHPEWLAAIPVAGAAPADVDTGEDYARARADAGEH